MAPTPSGTPPVGAAAPKSRWRDDPVGAFAAAFVVLVVAAVVTAVAFTRGRDGPDSSSSSAGFTDTDLHSLVADPRTPERLIVGGHQAVSVSDDDGASWTRLEALDNVDAMGWGFSPDDVWIGGHPGVVVLPGGGEAVQPRNDGLPGTDVHALGAGHGELYAAGPTSG
jgi:hypothetical protein